MMALTASTSGKLAQGPMNEDIAVITSQPVLLNECVSKVFWLLSFWREPALTLY